MVPTLRPFGCKASQALELANCLIPWASMHPLVARGGKLLRGVLVRTTGAELSGADEGAGASLVVLSMDAPWGGK